MKYLITEAQKYRLYRLAELMDDVAAMDGLNALKPIEPLSDEEAEAVWELLVDNNTDNIVRRFNRELTAHILGENT